METSLDLKRLNKILFTFLTIPKWHSFAYIFKSHHKHTFLLISEHKKTTTITQHKIRFLIEVHSKKLHKTKHIGKIMLCFSYVNFCLKQHTQCLFHVVFLSFSMITLCFRIKKIINKKKYISVLAFKSARNKRLNQFISYLYYKSESNLFIVRHRQKLNWSIISVHCCCSGKSNKICIIFLSKKKTRHTYEHWFMLNYAIFIYIHIM